MKTRKCKYHECRKDFERDPRRVIDYCCSPDCYYKQAMYLKKKQENEKRKKERLETLKMKERIETLSDVKKKLQSDINAIVRQIDKGHGCISCPSDTTPQAGHYASKGSNSALSFNLLNLWVQCTGCNQYKSGNIQEYDLGLIKLFGKEKWEYIKFDLVRLYPELKLSKSEVKEKAKLARAILRDLKKEERIYSTSERWIIREKINEKLGIYSCLTGNNSVN